MITFYMLEDVGDKIEKIARKAFLIKETKE